VTMGALEIENLRLAYDGGDILQGVSGRFPAGVLSAVVGPNGCGKTTLLKAIAGQLRPRAGAIRFTGMTHEDVAYLPQSAGFDRNFPISVREMVGMGLLNQVGAFGRVSREQAAGIDEAVAAVGLEAFAHRRIGALSGGQIQRAMFARLSLQGTDVILLDEPFANIDAHTTQALLRIMEGWSAAGRVVVTVLHDIDLAQRFFGWTMLLAHESVACGPTAEVLTHDNLHRAQHLCDACAADRNFWAAA
jgi:zinc/manganese transport system ATP-binding protein